jgi:predicted nucleotidyltransferase
MSQDHGLSEETVAQIAKVLAQFPNVERATLFGSRAKGTQKLGSDIDLALFGESLDWRLLGRVEDALEDLLLPYCFSLIIDDDKTDSAVAAHIGRVGQLFYDRNAMAGKW